MDLQEEALRFCQHIQTLTEVHCTLLNLAEESFCLPPCPCGCKDCDVVRTHLYGSNEAERWDGKYIYFCPQNFVFSAVTFRQNSQPAGYSVITGPFQIAGRDEEENEESDVKLNIPSLTAQQARSLNELVYSTCGYLTGAPVTPDVDSGRQAEILQMVYDLSRQPASRQYPVEEEQDLQESIRDGDKSRAQELLNRLLSRFYLISRTDLSSFKTHVKELLTIMAQGAMDGGADANEIFKFCYGCEQDLEKQQDFESMNLWLSATLHHFIRFMFDLTTVKHQHVIRKITALIQENLSEKITLDQAAEAVYLSKSYFCRVLKEELGCTFTEYVNRVRVEKSKKYLEHSLISVSEIAAVVGYEDPSYFTRIFKRIVGISPTVYRSLHQQKE